MDAASRVEEALTDPRAADRVEMVVRPMADDLYRAAAVDGWVEFSRNRSDDVPTYEVTATGGRNPLGHQAQDAFDSHATERRAVHPDRTENAYPFAFDSIAQFFDADHAPDLVAVHTAAHHVEDHHGQHGSLGVVQARAPFLAAGAGIRNLGAVPRATRVVDVAPTVAAVLGVHPHPEATGPTGRRDPGRLLRRQDGEVQVDLLDGERAEHAVVFLLDGCNANLFHDVIEAGEAPHLADLLARGTAYRHGSMASLPTATLANHTTALTGAHPGHSGVLHNTWHDRNRDITPDLLAIDQMFWAAAHLDDSVETLFEAISRSRPGAVSSATFEFCDRGATFSSFALVRERRGDRLPADDQVRHADPDARAASAAYRFMSGVDHTSMEHTVAMWAPADQRDGAALPALSWCSFAVTDEAGHESGPHGELARAAVRDSDARIGEVLAAVDRAGALERTAVFVIADHGMEQSDPAVSDPWDDVLEAAGVPLHEVGGGLIYLR